LPRVLATGCLLLGLLASIPGCDREARPTGAGAFKVALLTPGPVSDAGWNAAAFEGLQLIKSRLGAHIAMVQTTSPADFDDALRDFASRGFKLIFAHGFEYTDSALQAGRDFPATYFVVSSGSRASSNVASLSFRLEQAVYAEGVLAGMMSRTGIAGAVGGIELPSIRLTFEGFRMGFVAARPSGRVLISFTGSFEDVGAAKEAALAQVSRGADFLIHNADAAGLGVLQAARESHVYAFGTHRNQNTVAPEVTLASAVVDVPAAFIRIAAEVKSGTFHPAMIIFGMKDGMVKVVFNPKLKDRIPAAAMARFKSAEQSLLRDAIKLPTLPVAGSH
jgi:basic membrane protein A and related proteins